VRRRRRRRRGRGNSIHDQSGCVGAVVVGVSPINARPTPSTPFIIIIIINGYWYWYA